MVIYVVRLHGKVDSNRGKYYGAFSTQGKAQEWLDTLDERFTWQCEIVPQELDSLLAGEPS